MYIFLIFQWDLKFLEGKNCVLIHVFKDRKAKRKITGFWSHIYLDSNSGFVTYLLSGPNQVTRNFWSSVVSYKIKSQHLYFKDLWEQRDNSKELKFSISFSLNIKYKVSLSLYFIFYIVDTEVFLSLPQK